MKFKLTLVLFLSIFGFSNFSYGQCSAEQTTKNFSYTGAIEKFRVPDGVTEITMTVRGADGGGDETHNGGSGGSATSTFAVIPGEVLDVIVAESGISSSSFGIGGSGGGGSGVRRQLTNSVLIIGGGGGGANRADGRGGNNFPGIMNRINPNGVVVGPGANCIGCIRGGFGFGNGYEGSSSGGGGGGGGIGGFNGSFFAMSGSAGGTSFSDASGISQSFVNGVDGASNNRNGAVSFCFIQPSTPIPTMSEWGLIIFGLLTMNLGVVFLRRKEEILA